MARDWGVESMRLTLFSSDSITVSDTDWTALTGQADATTRQLIAGGRRYVGSYLGGQFIVAATAQRVDVSLAWQAPEQAPQTVVLPVAGSWEQKRDDFVAATTSWLTSAKFPVLRIAFAAVLLLETTNVHESYRVLKELVKSVSINPERMRELFFRVNWPQQSKSLGGISLNRITNWSAIQVASVIVQMVGQAVSTSSGLPEKFAVRLEVDHNTSQENKTPIEPALLAPIYRELVDLASENAERGEQL